MMYHSIVPIDLYTEISTTDKTMTIDAVNMTFTFNDPELQAMQEKMQKEESAKEPQHQVLPPVENIGSTGNMESVASSSHSYAKSCLAKKALCANEKISFVSRFKYNALVEEHNCLADKHNTLVLNLKKNTQHSIEYTELVAKFAELPKEKLSISPVQYNQAALEYNSLVAKHNQMIKTLRPSAL
jgi:hypothetical protein